jgi:hydrogenase maturation protease
MTSILIACIGNIFRGDDAFGVEVARRLAGRALPERVRVMDFGIRGLDLAYELLDGAYAAIILVDAAPRGGTPGTLYAIQPNLGDESLDDRQSALVETHGMDPMKVLRLAKAMGGNLAPVLVVGCEPLALGPEEGAMGLSAPVEAAVDEAVSLIESLVGKILAGEPEARPV